jgi:hypothetical protein
MEHERGFGWSSLMDLRRRRSGRPTHQCGEGRRRSEIFCERARAMVDLCSPEEGVSPGKGETAHSPNRYAGRIGLLTGSTSHTTAPRHIGARREFNPFSTVIETVPMPNFILTMARSPRHCGAPSEHRGGVRHPPLRRLSPRTGRATNLVSPSAPAEEAVAPEESDVPSSAHESRADPMAYRPAPDGASQPSVRHGTTSVSPCNVDQGGVVRFPDGSMYKGRFDGCRPLPGPAVFRQGDIEIRGYAQPLGDGTVRLKSDTHEVTLSLRAG